MIVRNESAVIERCLASVRGLVDSWTIVDTGSTDDTVARVRTALSGIPGAVYSRPWVDFASNRNELLGLGGPTADYLLLLDADMVLEVDDAQALHDLAADAYEIRVTGGVEYWMRYLVRADVGWSYVGRTHEYLSAPRGREVAQERLTGLRIVHRADGGSRADKFTRDLALLEAEVADHPDDARWVFYLAQTRQHLGDVPGALAAYARRIEMGGWDEEVFWSMFQSGGLLAARGDWPAAVVMYVTAWEYRPTRAEPLQRLASGFRSLGAHRTARVWAETGRAITVPDDRLFLERWVYDWGLQFEWSVAAWWTGDVEAARKAWRRLLERSDLTPEYRAAVEANLALPDPSA